MKKLLFIIFFLSLGFAFSKPALADYSSVILGDSPLGYWHLDETSGTSFSDSSGNGKTFNEQGTGMTLGVTGAINSSPSSTAVDMNATDCIKATQSQLGNTFTIEFWVMIHSTSGTGYVYSQSGTGSNPAVKVNAAGAGLISLHPGSSGASIAQTTNALSTNVWHYVVITHDSSHSHIYVDGTEDTNEVGSNTWGTAGGGNTFWGCNPNGSSAYINGALDEVTYYTSALTSTQVTNHYDAAVCPFSGGTLSYDGTYCYNVYTTVGSDTLTVNKSASSDVVIVAGGGGGGSTGAPGSGGGGGGGGGVLYETGVSISSNVSVTVGDGGGSNTNGQDSVFDSYTAIGGGAGRNPGVAGQDGGSGGGGGGNNAFAGGHGTAGQGHDGGHSISLTGSANGRGGGGGGAAAAGTDGDSQPDGGAGILISGFEAWGDSGYFGGGGGGGGRTTPVGNGGIGGGGNGRAPSNDGNPGTANTGGGGGGAGSTSPSKIGGTGGSGIVIVRTSPNGGPPTQAVFTNSSRTLTAGVCNGSGSVFTLQLQDGSGNPENPTGSTVINVSSNSTGTVTIYSDSSCTTTVSGGNFTFTTSDNTVSVYLKDTKSSSPTWTLTAHKTSGPDTISDGTQNYTLNPGSLDNYLVSVSTPQTAGVCFTGTNSVTARDSYNNTITSDSSVVDMTSTGMGVTFYTSGSCGSSTTQYTMSSGTSNIYLKTNKKQSFTVTATKYASTETGTSSSITVNAGSVSRLVITLPGQSFTDGSGNSGSVTGQTAGVSFTISKISATDDYYNVNTGYSGGKTLAYSGPSNAPDSTSPSYTTSVSFTNGQSTTTLTTVLYKTQSATITATDGGNYGNASSSVTVSPGDVSADSSDSTVTGVTNIPTGTLDTITITLKDTWRNPLSGISSSDITLASSGGGETITQPSSATNGSGQTTGSIQWSTAGGKTVSAAISGVSLVQNDGTTPDADGKLDNTLGVTVNTSYTGTQIKGGVNIKGGTQIN